MAEAVEHPLLPRRHSTAASSAVRRAIPVYVAAILVAEILVAFVSPLAGALVDALTLLFIANHHALIPPEDYGPTAADASLIGPGEVAVLPSLALVTILRIASLSLPLSEVSEAYWYIAMGAPVLLAVILAVHDSGSSWMWPPLFARDSRGRQVLFAVVGVPLGLLAFVAFDPQPLAPFASGSKMVAAAIGVFVFGGVLTEIIFRGLLQPSLKRHLGGAGIYVSSVIYGAMFLGAGSLGALAYFALVGVVFSVWAERTMSILGVALAHGVLNLGLLVVWPLLLG